MRWCDIVAHIQTSDRLLTNGLLTVDRAIEEEIILIKELLIWRGYWVKWHSCISWSSGLLASGLLAFLAVAESLDYRNIHSRSSN